MLVSVAMATFNGEKYIREQINSILFQTVQDFELIICDDKSTDGTLSILKEFEASDSRIKIIENDCNIGFRDNFAKAISLCRAGYIALSDQDDIWLPNHLELLLDNIKDNSLVCGDTLLIDSDGNSMGMSCWEQESFDAVPKSNIGKAMSFMLFRSPYLGSAMLFKRELAERALPIPHDLKYHDAWLFIVSCFFGGAFCVKAPISKYRRTVNSITGLRNKKVSRIDHLRRGIIWQTKLITINNLLERI